MNTNLISYNKESGTHPSEIDLALTTKGTEEINPELIASFERFEAYWASRVK